MVSPKRRGPKFGSYQFKIKTFSSYNKHSFTYIYGCNSFLFIKKHETVKTAISVYCLASPPPLFLIKRDKIGHRWVTIRVGKKHPFFSKIGGVFFVVATSDDVWITWLWARTACSCRDDQQLDTPPALPGTTSRQKQVERQVFFATSQLCRSSFLSLALYVIDKRISTNSEKNNICLFQGRLG